MLNKEQGRLLGRGVRFLALLSLGVVARPEKPGNVHYSLRLERASLASVVNTEWAVMAGHGVGWCWD